MGESKTLRPVGRIDFLDTKGQTGESCYYYTEEDFLKTVKEENYYGVPMVVNVFRDENGQTIPLDFVNNFDGVLKRAIVRALNRFNADDRATYLTLMKATIGDAIGLNGGSDEIDLLERRIDALNKRMISLVNENVQNGEDIESHEDEFKAISEETEQLKKRIEAIRESESKDESYADRLKSIQNTIDQREMNRDEYDDSIVRQMVECIKVYKDKRILIIFGGGYEVEEILLDRKL